MKELYTKPMAEVEEFKTVDVITTSGPAGGIEDIPGGSGGWDD